MSHKVLFFEPYSLASPHFETALELIQDHNDLDDELFVYQCNASLHFCDSNPSHDLNTCLLCIAKGCNGLAQIDGKPVSRLSFLKLTKRELRFIKNLSLEFEDIDDLKAFTYHGMDIGFGVASSLITVLKDPKPDTRKHRDQILRIIKSSLAVYFSLAKHLSVVKPDIVYLFNGRFALLRVVVRLCQRNGIEIRIHEHGSSKSKYNIIYNTLPHDLDSIKQRVISQWHAFPYPSERTSQASLFYEQRRWGVDQALPSFSKGMTDLSLPETWNPHKRNIVIFNSSEDEFASIGPEYHHRPFADQLEALRFIRDWAADKHDIDIYLRMHPRLQEISSTSVTELYRLNSPNFYVIRPESPTSSYTLIDHCDAVLTFGSRAGIEATFWGKPSILVGTAVYESFDVAHRVTDKQDLVNAILKYSHIKPKENTLPFGLYMLTYGIPYKHYLPDTFTSGTFKGRHISTDSLLLTLSRAKFSRKIFWPVFYIWHDHAMLQFVVSKFQVFLSKLSATISSFDSIFNKSPQKR